MFPTCLDPVEDVNNYTKPHIEKTFNKHGKNYRKSWQICNIEAIKHSAVCYYGIPIFPSEIIEEVFYVIGKQLVSGSRHIIYSDRHCHLLYCKNSRQLQGVSSRCLRSYLIAFTKQIHSSRNVNCSDMKDKQIIPQDAISQGTTSMNVYMQLFSHGVLFTLFIMPCKLLSKNQMRNWHRKKHT